MEILVVKGASGEKEIVVPMGYNSLQFDHKIRVGDLIVDARKLPFGVRTVKPIEVTESSAFFYTEMRYMPAGVGVVRPVESMPDASLPAPAPATTDAGFLPVTKEPISLRKPFSPEDETYSEYMARKAKEFAAQKEDPWWAPASPFSSDFEGVKPMSFAKTKRPRIFAYNEEENPQSITFIQLPHNAIVEKDDIIAAKSGLSCTLEAAYKYPRYESHFNISGYITCNKPGWGGGSYTVSRVLEDSGGWQVFRRVAGKVKYISANKIEPLPLP